MNACFIFKTMHWKGGLTKKIKVNLQNGGKAPRILNLGTNNVLSASDCDTLIPGKTAHVAYG
jgi:hypothetical protein